MNYQNFAQSIGIIGCQKNKDLFLNVATPGFKSEPTALMNSAPGQYGYEVDITTLTYIRQQVVEQKFYEIAPADYLLVEVGNGAFLDEILTWKTYNTAGSFFANMTRQSVNSRIQSSNIAIEAVKYPTAFWNEQLDYSLIEIQQASKTGNWSLIEAKEKARKKSWDLGIQQLAFLGHPTDTNFLGLLNLSSLGVNSNTSLITQSINSMNFTQFSTFVVGMVEAFRRNCNRTAYPNIFVIPESDFNQLNFPPSAEFPIGMTKLEYIKSVLATTTGNTNFQVKPLVYGDENFNTLGLNRYMLYNSTDDALKMDIPVNYTSTLAGTYNNFQWQSVAYGQFTGVQLFRPLEVLYFDYAN